VQREPAVDARKVKVGWFLISCMWTCWDQLVFAAGQADAWAVKRYFAFLTKKLLYCLIQTMEDVKKLKILDDISAQNFRTLPSSAQ
jgi:hypothetical protein